MGQARQRCLQTVGFHPRFVPLIAAFRSKHKQLRRLKSQTSFPCSTGTTGIIVDGPLLYNEGAPDHLKEVERIAPIGHTVRSATSTLCKLVSWYRNGSFTKCSEPVLLHQVRKTNSPRPSFFFLFFFFFCLSRLLSNVFRCRSKAG